MYKEAVIAEIVRKNSEHFGRGPTLFDYIKFRFIIRKWSYEKLLQGLVTMNINVAFFKLGVPHGAEIRASIARKNS